MPALVWDRIGDRKYESGLDKGVLYLPDGSAVPWNGLTSIVEKFDKEVSPIYYDGRKISNLVTIGDFQATMKAITYPDEFVEIEGLSTARKGVYFSDQPSQYFGLCYRTMVGNDVKGNSASYKIHILYNLVAIPSDKESATRGSDPNIAEFEWTINAVPEDIPGHRPTAHIIIDSSEVSRLFMKDLEEKLYGGTSIEAALMPMTDLIAFMETWVLVKIIDNGDGTWTANVDYPGYLSFDDDDPDLFQLKYVDAKYISDDTFVITDTTEDLVAVQLTVIDNGDGTWTATTTGDDIIAVYDDGYFEIRDIDPVFTGPDMYRITNTDEP